MDRRKRCRSLDGGSVSNLALGLPASVHDGSASGLVGELGSLPSLEGPFAELEAKNRVENRVAPSRAHEGHLPWWRAGHSPT